MFIRCLINYIMWSIPGEMITICTKRNNKQLLKNIEVNSK